ncbi:FAD:protein FMN transferase [Oricola sp.]|uniref:FAD:protein FMN transferase n=1 Tax=Oricola sp. TaxID=1979950 RepID=UPI0035130E96
MPKTFTDMVRHALNGPTMGTRWSALFHAPADFDPEPLRDAMVAAVDQVDGQMSVWKPDSDINRLSAASPDTWIDLPPPLMEVLEVGLSIGRAMDGAFDIGMGDAVSAWGFGPANADPGRIRAARERSRLPAHEVLELDGRRDRARKHAPIQFDLNGIAKGYGVDRLTETVRAFGIDDALLAIDGELRAIGKQPSGSPWVVAVEAPAPDRRTPHSILELADMAAATSGDYRHWVQVGDRRLSHTMDPQRGMPLTASPASVTVLATDCMRADALATAMMVLGEERGLKAAESIGLSVLYLKRDQQGGVGTGCFRKADEQAGRMAVNGL